LVIRDGAKYYATNRLTLTAAEVARLFRFRSQSVRECMRSLAFKGRMQDRCKPAFPHVFALTNSICVDVGCRVRSRTSSPLARGSGTLGHARFMP
jgi:hypothetical protein